MTVANYTTVRNNLKSYCNKAIDNDETIIITGKHERNVVMMSLNEYNRLMKQVRNAKYIEHLHEGIAQIKAGKGTIHELIEDDE